MFLFLMTACSNPPDDGLPGDSAPVGDDDDDTTVTEIEPLSALGPGDLVITEIMNKPGAAEDAYAEWIEVHNTTGVPVDLSGLEVSATVVDISFTVTGLVPIAAKGFAVLVRDGDLVVNGGVVGDFDYRTDLSLSNDRETLTLSHGNTVFDVVAYDDRAFFPDGAASTMALDPARMTAGDNDQGQYWCDGTARYGDGDLGTPGAPNEACPGQDDGDGDTWVEAHDCNDGAPAIHPDAVETGRDGIDQDCDGADSHATDLAAGELVITEIMVDPLAVDDGDGEWFEVVNTSSTSVNLAGLEVRDTEGLESFTVDRPVVVAPLGVLVFAVDADAADNGDLPIVDFDYPGSTFRLSNGGDSIVLAVNAAVIDAVQYSDVQFTVVEGRSLQLAINRVSAAGNDQPANWCPSTQRMNGVDTDFGTPGTANDLCP